MLLYSDFCFLNALEMRYWTGKQFFDRIIMTRFKSTVRQVVFVQVYAPTEQATSEERDSFYLHLNNSLDHLRKSGLNAKLGSDNSDWKQVMEKHGPGSMYDNGERFADLCSDRNLVIGSKIFPHRNIQKAHLDLS